MLFTVLLEAMDHRSYGGLVGPVRFSHELFGCLRMRWTIFVVVLVEVGDYGVRAMGSSELCRMVACESKAAG